MQRNGRWNPLAAQCQRLGGATLWACYRALALSDRAARRRPDHRPQRPRIPNAPGRHGCGGGQLRGSAGDGSGLRPDRPALLPAAAAGISDPSMRQPRELPRVHCCGSGYPVGGPYYANERKGKRVVCPECGGEYAAAFRALGRRGSGCGYEACLPRHKRARRAEFRRGS